MLRQRAALLLTLLLPTFVSVGWANPKLKDEVYDLEQQAKSLKIRFKTEPQNDAKLAEHRLVDAQVLYDLKDYSRAAIILLDYVSKYPKSRGYEEALFYLADSLYHKRDFLSSRRYFKKIVNEVRGRFYQESLQRLVELSLRIGDTSDVEAYLKTLSTIPTSKLKPSVPYVIGKYYFFSKQTDNALNIFAKVGPKNKYYAQSRYFIGACYVRKKDFAAALKEYQNLLRLPLTNDASRHVRDLAHLAVGRLLYHSKKTTEAIDQYQKISRRSKEFDTALYEIAWAYIKANKMKQALRALDLLVLAQPDSSLVPEVKVLQGNLLIRLKQWGPATDLFTKTRDKFVPIHKRMNQLLDEQKDPNIFFDVLLAKNLNTGSLAISVKVPKLAVRWVKERKDVKRSLHLVKDMHDVRASIDESKKLIKRLEVVINSPAKIRIFPDFATAARHSVEVDNRLVRVKQTILDEEYRLISTVATDEEKSKLKELKQKRAHLEETVKELPKTRAEFIERTKGQIKKIEALEKRVSKLAVVVQSLQAELIAAEKYFSDTAGANDAAKQKSFLKEANEVRGTIKALETEITDLREHLAQARRTAGVGGAEEVAERDAKKSFRDTTSNEHQLMNDLRTRLAGKEAQRFDELVRLMQRCDSVDKLLIAFNQSLERGVEDKLSVIRKTIAEEKAKIAQYDAQASSYKSQTDTVAGGLTYRGFQTVAKRFYEIVVRSDVGVIDVAWALKDAKSKEVSTLVRQSKRDLKLLDEEFKEVLKDKKN